MWSRHVTHPPNLENPLILSGFLALFVLAEFRREHKTYALRMHLKDAIELTRLTNPHVLANLKIHIWRDRHIAIDACHGGTKRPDHRHVMLSA